MTDTRTIVTVHPLTRPEQDTIIDSAVRVVQRPAPPSVKYDNDSTEVDAQGNLLVFTEGSRATGALWAAGTWARAEITEEPDHGRTAVDDAIAADPDGIAELIARRHYDGLAPFETSRDEDGPQSLANKLTAAALDGLRA